MKLFINYSREQKCKSLFHFFKNNYVLSSVEEAEVIVCLGGDGFMLHSIHNYIHLNKPFYGINCGSLGFLMNKFSENNLIEKINNAVQLTLHPLEVISTNNNNIQNTFLAFNEVSLLRSEGIAANLKITVDNELKINKLVSDGILVSSTMGSTAYNRASGGPVLPLNSSLFALTPINAFMPLNWKGAVLLDSSTIKIDVINPLLRKVNLFCDFNKHENITKIEIKKSQKNLVMLFDKDNNLHKKTLNTQFLL